MNKYQSIIGKTITLKDGLTVISQYSIVSMKECNEPHATRGKMYDCQMQFYLNGHLSAHKNWLFDETTLNELLDKNISYNPDMPLQSMSIELTN